MLPARYDDDNDIYIYIYIYIYFEIQNLQSAVQGTCGTLVWFLCLIAYQSSWVIQSRRTIVVVFKPLCMTPKVNVIARREFELAFYNVAVLYICHYTTWVPLLQCCTILLL